MTKNRYFNHCFVCALILITGLGFAPILPGITSSESLAAETEIGDPGSAPEVLNRFYVAKTGDGSDGLSWTTAFTKLEDALPTNAGPLEIWVAAGVYTPGTFPYHSFILKPGVRLYGGFDTDDVVFSDRDWEANVTVLSGDIDGNDISGGNGIVTNPSKIKGNNSYHIVFANGSSGAPMTGSTVLDGFTITAGQANSMSDPNKSGAGLYCSGSGAGKKCNLNLKNITFSGNSADKEGGAVYNDGSNGGESNPKLNNDTFFGNTAAENGGGMYNDGSLSGDSSPKLSNVTFSGNAAVKSGGAMFNDGELGGGSNPNLKNVTFSGNSAGSYGGAIYNNGYQGESSPTLINVTFSSNTSDIDGGAMYNDGSSRGTSSPSLTNVAFSGNSAGHDGGAMYNYGEEGDSSPDLYNVAFSGNSADYGGAMVNYSRTFTTSLYVGTSSPSMINVTFSGNSAVNEGGALYNIWYTGFGSQGECKPFMINGIIWNNKDSSGIGTKSASSYNNYASSIGVMNSILQGAGSSSNWTSDSSYVNFGQNIDVDPRFLMNVNPITAPSTAGNLRLQMGSPAIDVGENWSMDLSTDLDGNPRTVDGDLDGTPTVDMGAYEFQIDEVFMPLIFR